jgi:sporulation protein YlmC with PRC-barrel domain
MLQSIAELKRYPVYDERGDKLGVIDDVILDADDWRVCYAVLRYDAPGEPQKLLGVGLDALLLDSENECFVVAADADSLRQANGFEREAPPALPERLFTSSEH